MTSTIHVCHVISSLGVGGAERTLTRLVRGIDRGRFTSSVVSLTSGGALEESLRAAGAQVISLGVPRGSIRIGALIQLRRIIRDLNPNIVQSWMYHADLAATLATVGLSSTRLVWNIRHGNARSKSQRWVTRAARVLCGLLSGVPDAIVGCSRTAMIGHVQAGYRSKAMHLIPNGIPLAEFALADHSRVAVRASLGVPLTAPLVGTVSRYHPHKDPANLFRALAIVAERIDGAQFLICGRGFSPTVPDFLEWVPAEYHERFHFLGSRNDVPSVLAAMDVFVSASAVEAFPNAVAEAMAAGLPVVATDVGDTKDVLGETGEIVPRSDPAALAQAVCHLLIEDSDRHSLQVAARQRVAVEHSVEVMLEAYAELYGLLAAGSVPQATIL